MPPLTLLWRRNTLDRVPEAWFIERVLLAGVAGPVRVLAIEAMADAPFGDNMIVVSLTTEFAGWFAEARRRGCRGLTLLHLGDEQATDDLSFYAHADLVLRNYWFDAIMADPRVLWVPNGFAIGVGPATRQLPASQRRSAGYFAGALGMRALSGERAAMKAAVEQAQLPFRLHWTATSRDRLGAMAYAAALGDARFALVPGGNSPETIRLYDALELGAIPIMLASRFARHEEALGLIGPPPILLINDWADLTELYRRHQARGPDALDALQDEVMRWWDAFKRAVRDRVATRIAKVLTAAPVGPAGRPA